MGGEVNNTSQRKEIIKDLIKRLHEGESEEVIKKEFKLHFKDVSGVEIADAEKALMNEGVDFSEVQSLCSIHASIFEDAVVLNDKNDYANTSGHPIYILKKENKQLQKVIAELRAGININNNVKRLLEINNHYKKKEELIFPILERYGITAPPKVMWGVDDEIRALIKQAYKSKASDDIEKAIIEVEEMIFKEENILIPMMLDTFNEKDWYLIAQGLDEVGYCLIDANYKKWEPIIKEEPTIDVNFFKDAFDFETGTLRKDELNAILNALPIDITFVDKDDRFRYFSNGKDRIFTRTKAAIGRHVSNCHPAQSVHIVEKILSDFKSNKKDEESFWLKLMGKYIYIQYFALRDDNNEYLGTLEVSQDINPIQAIEGEKRLSE